jgi:large subunit ribosomal protein L22
MNLDFKACHRFARTSHRKVRYVIDLIRGRTVNQALTDLKHDKHRASRFVEKVLASAVANALQNPEVKPNRLVVSAAFVNTGPLQFGRFRFRPGPRGRAMPIKKKTCHIHVHVADPGEGEGGERRRGKRAKGAKQPAAPVEATKAAEAGKQAEAKPAKKSKGKGDAS